MIDTYDQVGIFLSEGALSNEGRNMFVSLRIIYKSASLRSNYAGQPSTQPDHSLAMHATALFQANANHNQSCTSLFTSLTSSPGLNAGSPI